MKRLTSIMMISVLLYAQDPMKLFYISNGCSSCHGMYGEGIGASPRIQGVRAEKLLRRLKNLQAGKPRSPFGTVMVSFAQSMDENQTIQMANYLSNLKTVESEEKYELEFDQAGDGSS